MNVSVVAVSTQLKDYLLILVFVPEPISHKILTDFLKIGKNGLIFSWG